MWSPGRRLFAPTIVFPPYHLLTWVLVEHARRFTVVVNFEDIDILRLAGRAELSQTVACGLTVFAGLIPFKGSTVSETQLAEVPCAHPRFGLCRSRHLSPSFSRVAYLTPRTCPRHPSSLSSSLSPLASPSLSSLDTVDLVRRRYSHPCRCPHPLRSLLVLATIALVAVASAFCSLAPCITPRLGLGRMRALTASFLHLLCDSLLASALTAANSIYYLPQLHAALDL